MRKLIPILALAAAAPLRAQTTPNCSTVLDTAHPQLWLQIGDTQEALIKNLGAHLRGSTAHPIQIVYITAGSCVNVPNIQGGVKFPQGGTVSYIPAGFNPATASPTCINDTVGGHKIDVANAALFVSTCQLTNTPTVTTSTSQGPNQAYTLVVPSAASPTAITAEEAYFVFGFGNNSGFGPNTPLSPWNDITLMFTRPSTKSTLLTWVATLSVPGGDAAHTFTPAKFMGTPKSASSDVVAAVTGSPTPEKTIGLLGAEVYDANPSGLKELAFQWFGQTHAYFPDSTLGAHDKKNLRDGHYAVWSPTFWLQEVNGQTPVNPDADFLIKLILGQQGNLEVNPVLDVIHVGLVPACAMSVNRTVEGGPLSPFAPTPSCACFYDANVVGGHSSCATCTTEGSTCPSGGVCHAGFCEAR
jgi:hypothetical protein